MLLDFKDVHIHYGQLKAVRGISMEIEEGSVVGLLGANGSGKSTCLKGITGLKSPVAGEIWFDGQRIDGRPTHRIVRQGIAMVPEGKGLFPYMSVADNLLMGTYSRRDRAQAKRDIAELMVVFPILKERQKMLAGLLSGGEQEMLAIARSLLANPRLLLLDEPLQGLAPVIQEQIAEIVLGLNRDRGLSILMIEHNVHMALEMCHWVYILETGQVYLKGKPDDLSQTEYVQKIFLAD